MRVHHRLDGPEDAPVLVLANSLGTTMDVWSRTAPYWERSFRVLRYDLRGHGESQLPPGPFGIDDLGRDVVALLDRLGIERASFCGLSLGGAVGQWLAVNEPGRIDRLVLACTLPRFGEPQQWLDRASRVRAEGVESVVDSVLRRWFTPTLFERDGHTAAAFREMLLATPAEAYAVVCEALAGWDYRDRVHEIGVPTLVLVGADDPVMSAGDVGLLARIPGARLVELSGAAHLPNVERPDAFAAAVSEHLSLREAA